MRLNLSKFIFYILLIFIPSCVLAESQYATFHGFDHRTSFHQWQQGKILTVDNRCVSSDFWGNCEGSWDPIQVTPGIHIIGVSSPYSYGFMQGPYTGYAAFKIKFAAGRHYFLNGNMVAERIIRLWVQDAQGRTISNVVTVDGNYHSDVMSFPAVYTRTK